MNTLDIVESLANNIPELELPSEFWSRFSFEDYHRDEQQLLKPALEAQGFTNVVFSMGEQDSFGPLSRVVTCEDKTGKTRYFVYG